MKFTSTLALAATLALSGVSLAVPAIAQEQAAQPAAPARKFDLSKEARPALAELQKAVDAQDEAVYPTALAAAKAAAKTADDRYVIGQFQLKRAIALKSDEAQVEALQTMVDSGGAAAQEVPTLVGMVGSLAYNTKNYDLAAQSFERVAQLQPENIDAAVNVAKIRAQQQRPAEAVAAMQALFAREKAANRPVAEANYRLALQYAMAAKMGPQISGLSRELVTTYPTPDNWRIGLSLYRDGAQLDKPAALDLLRLMRASKSLNGERDWFELASAANDAGLPGEAKAVLDEGTAARQVDTSKPVFKDLMALAQDRIAEDRRSLPGLEKEAAAAATGRPALGVADAYLGYGDYAKAAQLYRTAIQKGSVDANVANTRLGIALALQGQKAEAEAALKAVGGSRTELANLWMLWLSQRG